MTARRVTVLCGTLWLVGCTNGQTSTGTIVDQTAGLFGVPTMTPGESCLSCHCPDSHMAGCTGKASQRVWTVAGTVYNDPMADAGDGVAGVEVIVVGDAGTITMVSNAAGNFYTAEDVGAIEAVIVQNSKYRMQMNTSVKPPAGDCNGCHASPPVVYSNAFGRVFVPKEGP
jgi:hypothetical protein